MEKRISGSKPKAGHGFNLAFGLVSGKNHPSIEMAHAETFYPERHAKEPGYSGASYHTDSLLRLGSIKSWAKSWNDRPIRMLDVGCGKGVFLRDFASGLRQRYGIKAIQGAGVDLVRSPGDFFSEICPDFKFVQQNLDGQSLPFADSSFDFLCCNQVLEHVFETEKLLREFRRVLTPQGICVVSVPNLASWINRIVVLFGGQPLGSEIGTESVTYGFWPTFLQSRLKQFTPSGHIRDFSPRGLKDITAACGFEALHWWKQTTGPLSRLTRCGGPALALVLRPSSGTKR